MTPPPDEYSLMAPIYDPATAWALDPLRREVAAVAADFLANREQAGGSPCAKGGVTASADDFSADRVKVKGHGNDRPFGANPSRGSRPGIRPEAGRILDVCCGTARQCHFFAKAGLAPVGLDLSPGMLTRASRLADRVLLVRGDACELPFPNACFSFTSVALALHEKPPRARPRIVAEMLRVTAPGGMVAVVDYLAPHTDLSRVLGLGVKAVERLAGREHHAYYADFMLGGGLMGFLSGLGLAPCEVRRRFFGLIGLALLRRPI